MVELLGEVARRALALSGLAVLLDVVLPTGNMRRCARLVVSVLLLAAVIEPVVQAWPGQGANQLAVQVFTGGVENIDNTEEIIAAGVELSKRAQDDELARLAADWEREIAEYVRGEAGLADCEVQVELTAGSMEPDGALAVGAAADVGQVLIMVSADELAGAAADDVCKRVAELVAARWGLAGGEVQVSVVRYASDWPDELDKLDKLDKLDELDE